MKWKEFPPLPAEYYLQDDVLFLSEDLLGKYLCTFFDGVYCAGKIVETEAYRAPDDKASHAYGNRRTARTETMFQPGGRAYVYMCYGIHHLFNVVTNVENTAHAILIRAIEPAEGISTMLQRRGMGELHKRLSSGPGSLTRALGIYTRHNGTSLLEKSLIWIEDRQKTVGKSNILRSPRVGVDYAEECAIWNWRFRIAGNPWCSPAK